MTMPWVLFGGEILLLTVAVYFVMRLLAKKTGLFVRK